MVTLTLINYTPDNKVLGVYRKHLVRLSVCLCKFVFGQYRSNRETLQSLISQKSCLSPEGVSRPWPRLFGKGQGQGHRQEQFKIRFRSTSFFMEKHWKFSSNKHCLWHGGVSLPWPKSFGQGQGQEKCKLRVRTKSF